MKSFRKTLLILLVLLLIPMMAACGDKEDDGDDEESTEFTVKRDKNTPEGVLKSALRYSDSLEKAMDDVESTFLMFSNKKALKKLDMLDNDEDDEKVSYEWKITKSEEYDEDADLTASVKAYVRMQTGDSSAIEQTALVEVEDTITVAGEEPMTRKQYYTLSRIDGTWYMVSGNAVKKDSFDEAVEYWKEKTGR